MARRQWFLGAAIAASMLVACGGDGGGETGGSTSTGSTTTTTTVTPPACGDGKVDDNETCDDGNKLDGDGCSAACAPEDGYTCTGAPSVCTTTCGDGVVAGGEACDDGGTVGGDGCSEICTVQDGFTCTGAPSACVTTCGDGIIAGAEVCDDSNTTDDDGCSAACAVESGFTCDMASPTICSSICGDGQIVGAETCDDNNAADGDGCSALCAPEAGYTCTGAPSACVTTCGDGIHAGVEGCDDSNALDGDGCSAVCGIETGWVCDGEPSICGTTCGDGIKAGPEVCDDGNTTSNDGCAAACDAVEPGWTCPGSPSACVTTCGDGVIAGVEVCDDGNTAANDGCSSICTAIEAGWTCTGAPSVCTTTCGDSVIAGAEKCDDGNTAGNDGCTATCQTQAGWVCSGTPSACVTVCGDGVTAGAEACDDFNTSGGDGCAASCGSIELGYTCNGPVCTTTCGDGIAAGLETCDDGNAVDGDGCSSACAAETGYTCSGAPSVCTPLCGDGVKITGEKCDDGNTVNGDCCSATCQIEPGCEVEANDTVATANDFAFLANGNKIKGIIAPSSDVDTFMVTVPAGFLGNIVMRTLEVSTPTCLSSQLDTTVTLLDSNGVSIGSDTDSGDGYCSVLTVLGLAPGNYYVQVKKGTYGAATFLYQLQVDISTSVCGNGTVELGEQCDDNNSVSGDGCTSLCKLEPVLETEPNNTCGVGTSNGPYALPPNLLVAGAVNTAGESDYYAITVSNYADLRLETFDSTGPGSCSSIDTKISFYNSSCTSLGTDDDGSLLPGNCSLLDPTVSTQSYMKHLSPGTYYVQVFPYSSSATFSYTMLATLTAICGNNIKEGSEQCDGTPGCGTDCLILPACGNGIVESGEACDDGDLDDGDGCSATCTVEPNYLCSGTNPSTCIMPCTAGQTLVRAVSTDVPKAILDATPAGAVSVINIAQTGTVQRVMLQLDITHGWLSDVDIFLISPNATTLDISTDNGSSSDNYTNTVFDDLCPPITGGTPPYTGCFSPEQPLATLNGQSATGTWTLNAIDDLGGIAGTLNSWSIALCVQ